MKAKVLILLASFFAAFSLMAQSGQYTQAMKQQLGKMDSAATPAAWQQSANAFERIAKAEKTEWLPFYYAAYCIVMHSYIEQDVRKLDALLDKADEVIAQAAALQPNHSEITTIQAMIMQSRMRVDMSRGMTLGPKSAELLQKAMQQAPQQNPRALMNLAQNLYYTPEAYGGSRQKGMALMQQSLTWYDTFVPENELAPSWGKGYVARTLKQWQTGQ